MNCPNCNYPINPDERFCPNCGAPVLHDNAPRPLNQPPYMSQPPRPGYGPQVPYPQQPRRNNALMITIIAAACVIICVLLILVFMGKNEESKVAPQKDTIVVATNDASTVTPAAAPAPAGAAPASATPPDNVVAVKSSRQKYGSSRSAGYANDYSDMVLYQRLTPADLSGLSGSELRILRNTIYARHGYIFKSADLRRYFSQFSWYVPRTSNISLNDFSEIERHNVELIKRYE